jgi:ribosomal protein S11
MLETSAHPPPATLLAFHSGHLTAAQQAEVERHLVSCSVCLDALKALPESAIIRLARQAMHRTTVTDATPFPDSPRRSPHVP